MKYNGIVFDTTTIKLMSSSCAFIYIFIKDKKIIRTLSQGQQTTHEQHSEYIFETTNKIIEKMK